MGKNKGLNLPIYILRFEILQIGSLMPTLKVDGNEKLGRSKRRQYLNFIPALWRWKFICNLNVQFLCEKYISISACCS
jgi:hypothetical protein